MSIMTNQTESLPTEDEVAQVFRDTHPKCAECGERGCPFNADGTWAPEHFGCCEDGLEPIGDGNYVHVACKPQLLTCAIRDEIRDIMLERYGFEINEMTASERANCGSIRVYGLLRSLGVVK